MLDRPFECHHDDKPPMETTEPTPTDRHPRAKHLIGVMSGKGGVGKSTVAVNLASALSARGARVGIVDTDVYGPNVPRMLGLTRKQARSSWTVWKNPAVGTLRLEPVEVAGLQIMSAGFIAAEGQPIAWSAHWVRMLVKQLIFDTLWSDLDYLIIDFPPGTGDVHQEVIGSCRLSGVVLVGTPQDVSHLDLQRTLTVITDADIPVIAVVENMSGVTCPDCGTHIDLYPRAAAARSTTAALGPVTKLPFDPTVAWLAEQGRPVVATGEVPEIERAFIELAEQVQGSCPAD